MKDVHPTPPAEPKSALRTRLLRARRELPEQVREREAARLTERLVELAAGADTVCAYVPIGAEPGRPGMLDALVTAGVRVLVPVVASTADGAPLPLRWGAYHPAALQRARFGLQEPTGPTLPPATIAEAQLIVVPAVAVDRRGARLGRGAGYYDRSLPLRASGVRLVALVRDCELVDELPAEPHDVPMTHALTPETGLTVLGSTECEPAS